MRSTRARRKVDILLVIRTAREARHSKRAKSEAEGSIAVAVRDVLPRWYGAN